MSRRAIGCQAASEAALSTDPHQPTSSPAARGPGSCATRRTHWEAKWADFKARLPHQQQPFAKREWGGPAHSLCSYQGKIKPSLAHHLIHCFTEAGGVVVDPFSGAGTIPFEACRMQRRGYGIDISRLGFVLTWAKVARPNFEKAHALSARLERAIEAYRPTPADYANASAIRFNSAITAYFHPDTLREVLAARHFFLSQPPSDEWALLLACTLHLLHGNRPYALSRRSHPVTPFKPSGDFEYRALIPRLQGKLRRVEEALSEARPGGGAVQGDCTLPWPDSIPMADAIITSPPFFDSTRFYMSNWMRLWFVGWERADFDNLPKGFLEDRQKLDLDVYFQVFERSRRALARHGVLVLHLGHSRKCDMGAELTRRATPWFRVQDRFTEGVEHCESHGIRDKGSVRGHTYLVMTPR